jgi:hypothetical protein
MQPICRKRLAYRYKSIAIMNPVSEKEESHPLSRAAVCRAKAHFVFEVIVARHLSGVTMPTGQILFNPRHA